MEFRKIKNLEYYYNEDGDIVVLISEQFGSGWSTSNGGKIELAVDKRIVEFFLKHIDDSDYMQKLSSFNDNEVKTEAKKYFASMGYKDVCFFGAEDIDFYCVPKGSKIEIREYDGDEELIVLGLNDGFVQL